jgi:hypothetical protein
MRYLTILIGAALASAVNAQNVVLPQSAQGVAGGTANSFPWGINTTAWPGLRIMSIYDSSHFINSAITTPILITHVRWRADDAPTTTTWTGGTYNFATLSLATAAVDYSAASTNWASNVGPDYTQVYSGPVVVQPGTGPGAGVPGPMVVDIALTTPFLYDPNAGDLVVDTNYTFPGNWTGGTQITMDVATTNVLGSRIYSSSLYPTANGIDAAVPVIEIGYGSGGGTVAATNTNLGAGCISGYTSFYQSFATAASFDLAGTSLSMIPAGGGYTVVNGLFPYVAPTPAATLVAVGDDVEQSVPIVGSFPYPGGSTSALQVCSNGFVSVAAGNGISFSPSSSAALAYTQTAWGDWHDYYPVGGTSGNVKFEQVGSVAYITWDAVVDFGSSTPNTWQLQFDTATGIVTQVFVSSSLLGSSHLVFYSPGGASADPGNTDLSVAVPLSFSLAAADTLPLALAAGTRPITGASWNLNVTHVPVSSTIGIEIFGLTDPGINDLAFLGAPTCGLRASLDFLNAWVAAGGAPHPYSLGIPNNPLLLNQHVFTTSAVLVPGVNTLLGGAITANGINGKIGDY